MTTRTFLKNTSLLGIGSLVSYSSLGKLVSSVAHIPATETAQDEDFRAGVRSGYQLKSEYINLENGYYCFIPQVLLEKHFDHIRALNLEGSHYLRTVQFDNKNAVAKKLAALAGCSVEELIITRNTTELRMKVGSKPIAIINLF